MFNAVFSFLPENLQKHTWLRITSMVVATIILLVGIAGSVIKFKTYTYAHVTPDGAIVKSKNFPWEIEKTVDENKGTVYLLRGRYGDATSVSVKPEKPIKIETYNGISGICIRFKCNDEQLTKFKITINN